ncbi:amidohydrolase family protein [Novosphingobium rosa]|uniref:amidohydrolase family protein n=1 Tax=Novosphingobium rosa TaxID=76978 RepID=UPI000829755D|nr:amidohydrolase family protein [Novosphingobium rosa]
MIDAHVHLWRPGLNDCTWPGPDMPALHRDVLPEELWAEIGETGVSRVVLVQSQESEADTHWLLDLAHADDRIAGVIGWSDFTAPAAPARIDRVAARGKLLGIRPMVQDRADDWYDDPALDPALAHLARRGLVLEALVRPRHLAALARCLGRHPDLRVIIDHAAKPTIGEADMFWEEAMKRLAVLPQVACKVSGLVTELAADGAAVAVLPSIARIRDLFGPERLIWGSDWPVVTLRESYRDWLALARSAIPSAEHSAVFGGNARRIYGLPS